MSRVNEITEFPIVLIIDNNQVFCQAIPHPHNHTCVCLVTPEDTQTKTLVVSATNLFGVRLQCGDGGRIEGFNAGMRFNRLDLGENCGNLAIQFRKTNILGIETAYESLTLPDTLKDHEIVFFWPNDAPGNYWNHFIGILEQARQVTDVIAGITEIFWRVIGDVVEFLKLWRLKHGDTTDGTKNCHS